MTDEELIARLRLYGSKFHHEFGHNEAADRIEALLNLNEALVELMDDRDAKLAKAVEALELIAGVKGPYSRPFPEAHEGYGAFAVVKSREALDELEGEK